MKKHIAVITKEDMKSSDIRADILADIQKDGGFSLCICDDSSKISDEDVVLIFGGDGTVLEVVRAVAEKNIPILCVNLGNLGFLAEYERSVNSQDVVNALKSSDLRQRMMLCVNLSSGVSERALNEVVIRSLSSRPIYIDVYVDGKFVDSYHSDGAIVSSPTGSTAYSLSAGGPILAPDVYAFVINPICAHSLHSRPLVVSADSIVEMRVKGECACVCVDGNTTYTLGQGGIVTVKKSSKTAKFVCSGDDEFYKKLLQKMNRWGTTECTEG